jgi:hypothetical protein
MTTQEQTKSECSMPKDKSDHMDPSVQPRDLTRKQMKLARFIADEYVAKFEAVVEAIKNRRYKQVDEWKAEASVRAATPPKLDPIIAECLARQKARLEGRR